jgi:hypothetical protein
MGTGSFPGVKGPGRGVDHPPPYIAEVKERVELYVYSPSGPSWSVLGWTSPFTFTFLNPALDRRVYLTAPAAITLISSGTRWTAPEATQLLLPWRLKYIDIVDTDKFSSATLCGCTVAFPLHFQHFFVADSALCSSAVQRMQCCGCNGYANAPKFYFIINLPILFVFFFFDTHRTSHHSTCFSRQLKC